MTTEIKRDKTVAFWVAEIKRYERDFGPWEERSKKIVKRYWEGHSGKGNDLPRFNILWSNTQTLAPALFDRNPVPNVDRRFEDEDELATVTARVLERATTYYIDTDDFTDTIQKSVLDRLLPGRGVAWVRYDFKEEAKLEGPEEGEEEPSPQPAAPSYKESVAVDYVHWQDFGHSYARTWEEVPAVWRKVSMTRAELIERFGEKKGNLVPLDDVPDAGKGTGGGDPPKGTKACVYEIWDKRKKKALWVHPSVENVLDELDDPLKLHDFFPCPKPLFATLTNDNLIPSPDFLQYQHQALELDNLTARIGSLTKAVKVAGVYDATAEGLAKLLGEGVENTLVPVANWALFGEKGGLSNVINFLPVKEIVEVLIALYEAREKVKQDLYEITGISDIIRGATDPNETLGAQELKGKYAGLRIGNMQKDVARFNRALVRIVAEIIAEHFSMETIRDISGIKLLTEAEKTIIQAQVQGQPMQPGQPPAQPQIPPEIQELLSQPTWEQVMALLKNDMMRCFKITIETDSTIKPDQDLEKQQRNELLAAVGGYMQQAIQLPPDLQPLAAELLMFGVRGFKISRELEATFESALKKIKERAEAPPQPDPAVQAEQAKADMEMQKMQGQMQVEQVKGQIELTKAQSEIKKAEMEQQRMMLELQLKDKDIQIKQLDLMIKSQVAQQKQEQVNAN